MIDIPAKIIRPLLCVRYGGGGILDTDGPMPIGQVVKDAILREKEFSKMMDEKESKTSGGSGDSGELEDGEA